jgi:hypothetical protein
MTALTKDRNDFLKAVGDAVQSYAEVEKSQARLLQCILGVDSIQAATIFFTIQNVRSRNELFSSLAEQNNLECRRSAAAEQLQINTGTDAVRA